MSSVDNFCEDEGARTGKRPRLEESVPEEHVIKNGKGSGGSVEEETPVASNNYGIKEGACEAEVKEGDGVVKMKKSADICNPVLDGPDELTERIRSCWEESRGFEEGSVKIQHQPFRHGELRDFVKDLKFVNEFKKLFEKLEFQEKASDLFQFKQSDDLSSIVDPNVYALNESLQGNVLQFLKKITGLPLNGTVDMFLSKYSQKDFLLCHDDELDSRRIAFIWYLSEDWKEEYGGTLDLFSATDELHPKEIVQKIVPEFNRFVFFEVGATSFHQVSEVLKDGKPRLALSGWFYGDPLCRPKIEFPVEKTANVLEHVQKHDGILKRFCADMYLNPEIFAEINEQLSEESEVLVPGFLRDEIYESICKNIVEIDVSDSVFQRHGPPNMAQFDKAFEGGPPENTPGDLEPQTIQSLIKFFYSAEFLDFMEKITEFPFTSSSTNRVASSLQKYSHGSYSLLKVGGAKQTGLKSGFPDQDMFNEEEEPNFVDVMFYFANKWDEERGGLQIYSTVEGEQLITVPPEGNCLAVVVRSSTVNSYTNYVNCKAKDDVFFVFKMTFAFDGNL